MERSQNTFRNSTVQEMCCNVVRSKKFCVQHFCIEWMIFTCQLYFCNELVALQSSTCESGWIEINIFMPSFPRKNDPKVKITSLRKSCTQHFAATYAKGRPWHISIKIQDKGNAFVYNYLDRKEDKIDLRQTCCNGSLVRGLVSPNISRGRPVVMKLS